MAFDELTDEELAVERRRIFVGAIEAARLAAAQRLSTELGHIVDAPNLVGILVTHDAEDPRYDLLKAFEKRWALLVLRLRRVGGARLRRASRAGAWRRAYVSG